MKRTIAILLCAVLLVGVLTACSGTAMYDDRYGHVSNTPNGHVNGYNRNSGYDRQNGENRTGFAGGNASGGFANGDYSGSGSANGSSGSNYAGSGSGGSYAGGSSGSNYAGGAFTGDHGTGMIGGQEHRRQGAIPCSTYYGRSRRSSSK